LAELRSGNAATVAEQLLPQSEANDLPAPFIASQFTTATDDVRVSNGRIPTSDAAWQSRDCGAKDCKAS